MYAPYTVECTVEWTATASNTMLQGKRSVPLEMNVLVYPNAMMLWVWSRHKSVGGNKSIGICYLLYMKKSRQKSSYIKDIASNKYLYFYFRQPTYASITPTASLHFGGMLKLVEKRLGLRTVSIRPSSGNRSTETTLCDHQPFCPTLSYPVLPCWLSDSCHSLCHSQTSYIHWVYKTLRTWHIHDIAFNWIHLVSLWSLVDVTC